MRGALISEGIYRNDETDIYIDGHYCAGKERWGCNDETDIEDSTVQVKIRYGSIMMKLI